ncbi:MAG: hypothetical protein JWQ71_1408 [Pedosphaera sp.]|nr:hypothetical protein [Pedosphaera sp.]
MTEIEKKMVVRNAGNMRNVFGSVPTVEGQSCKMNQSNGVMLHATEIPFKSGSRTLMRRGVFEMVATWVGCGNDDAD